METPPAAGRDSPPLVILGASVRALAESAQRAGWSVYAADLFRDLDLVAVAREAVRVTAAGAGYPRGLAVAAAGFPGTAPWCYTGGLENHPDLLGKLAATRPLAGNSADLVSRIRDPASLAAAVTAAGLAFPETRARPDGLPTDGSFLLTPLATAGGRGIRPWTRATAACWQTRDALAAPAAHVWQRFISGTPMSAGYVMSAGSARLLGITRQLIGSPWCRAARFAWCGGVTDTAPVLRQRFERLGAALHAAFHPVGAIGVDAIVDPSGHMVVLEVNPRPTASLELFERSCGLSIAASHLSACGQAAPPHRAGMPPHDPGWHWSKAVLFAPRTLPVTPPLVESLRSIAAAWTGADDGWAALADIPAPGQEIAGGAPACTLFARGRRPDEALQFLHERVTAVDRLLAASPRVT